MKEVIKQLNQWREADEEIAITTVIETWGSAPRPVGAKMATTRSGGIAGSVSAGCVEGAVIQESEDVINSGEPRLIEFGVADETAWEVGLACGGRIKVLIEPGFSIDSIFNQMTEYLEKDKPFLTITSLDFSADNSNKKLLIDKEGNQFGDLILPVGEEMVLDKASALLDQGKSGVVVGPEGESLFIETYPLPPRLIIVGAVHLALPLTKIATFVGFEVILVDPRKAFASNERFPHVNRLVREWPDEALREIILDKSAYIVVLTHDPKLDDPGLLVALESDARYVGALGSRKTNQNRMERLRAAGLQEKQLSRLHAPVGLDLGGRSTEEIAISIMAEIVQVKNEGAR